MAHFKYNMHMLFLFLGYMTAVEWKFHYFQSTKNIKAHKKEGMILVRLYSWDTVVGLLLCKDQIHSHVTEHRYTSIKPCFLIIWNNSTGIVKWLLSSNIANNHLPCRGICCIWCGGWGPCPGFWPGRPWTPDWDINWGCMEPVITLGQSIKLVQKVEQNKAESNLLSIQH